MTYFQSISSLFIFLTQSFSLISQWINLLLETCNVLKLAFEIWNFAWVLGMFESKPEFLFMVNGLSIDLVYIANWWIIDFRTILCQLLQKSLTKYAKRDGSINNVVRYLQKKNSLTFCNIFSVLFISALIDE